LSQEGFVLEDWGVLDMLLDKCRQNISSNWESHILLLQEESQLCHRTQ